MPQERTRMAEQQAVLRHCLYSQRKLQVKSSGFLKMAIIFINIYVCSILFFIRILLVMSVQVKIEHCGFTDAK